MWGQKTPRDDRGGVEGQTVSGSTREDGETFVWVCTKKCCVRMCRRAGLFQFTLCESQPVQYPDADATLSLAASTFLPLHVQNKRTL